MYRNTITVVLCLLVLTSAAACSRKQSKEKYLASGDKFFAAKQYKEAIIQYRNAIGVEPLYGDARWKLAQAYEQTSDLPNAFKEFIRAAELLPDNVEAQIKAGQLLLLGRRFEDAKTRADKALEKDPKNVAAQILKGNATAGLKDLDGAIGEIDEAIKLNPTEGRAFAALGNMKMAKGQQAEAEAAFKKAVELQPTEDLPLMSLANFYWSTGRLAEVEAPL